MTICRVRLSSYAIPLPEPWPSAEGPIRERIGTILLLEEEDGLVGRGETAPWPGFGVETHASSVAALRLAARRLIGLPHESYLAAAADLHRLAPVAASPCARHAIDLALHDLAARRAGLSIARLLAGKDALDRVPVNAAIPRLPADRAAREARAAVSSGIGTIKLKVGGAPIEEDAARVRAVREAVGPDVRIRVDANQAWSEKEAIAALRELEPYALEYCEQPVAAEAIESLARVRAAVRVPIAADEAVRDAATALRILTRGAADVLILKPMVLGGLTVARRVAAHAEEHGAEIVVTSLLESPIGRAGALHFAASLGPRRFAHGVGAGPGQAPPDGMARVPEGPGLGVEEERAPGGSAELVAAAEEDP